jgi:hypothetical protein
VRHHWPETAYGLRLQGALTWSGDTRPIPEMLARFASDNELIAHDCGLHGNPSHTGVDDLEREYSAELQARMMLYHYASVADGARWPRAAPRGAAGAVRAAGHPDRAARAGPGSAVSGTAAARRRGAGRRTGGAGTCAACTAGACRPRATGGIAG